MTVCNTDSGRSYQKLNFDSVSLAHSESKSNQPRDSVFTVLHWKVHVQRMNLHSVKEHCAEWKFFTAFQCSTMSMKFPCWFNDSLLGVQVSITNLAAKNQSVISYRMLINFQHWNSHSTELSVQKCSKIWKLAESKAVCLLLSGLNIQCLISLLRD